MGCCLKLPRFVYESETIACGIFGLYHYNAQYQTLKDQEIIGERQSVSEIYTVGIVLSILFLMSMVPSLHHS